MEQLKRFHLQHVKMQRQIFIFCFITISFLGSSWETCLASYSLNRLESKMQQLDSQTGQADCYMLLFKVHILSTRKVH